MMRKRSRRRGRIPSRVSSVQNLNHRRCTHHSTMKSAGPCGSRTISDARCVMALASPQAPEGEIAAPWRVTLAGVVLAWARARPLVRPSRLVSTVAEWVAETRILVRRSPCTACRPKTCAALHRLPSDRSWTAPDRVPTATVGTEIAAITATMAGCGDAECPLPNQLQNGVVAAECPQTRRPSVVLLVAMIWTWATSTPCLSSFVRRWIQ